MPKMIIPPCPVCGRMLKRYYRNKDTLHTCSPCSNKIAEMETKAKRIFGE